MKGLALARGEECLHLFNLARRGVELGTKARQEEHAGPVSAKAPLHMTCRRLAKPLQSSLLALPLRLLQKSILVQICPLAPTTRHLPRVGAPVKHLWRL